MRIFNKIKYKIKQHGISINLLQYVFNFLLSLPKRYNLEKMLRLKSTKDRFSKIYNDNIWGSDESRSGKGSELKSTINIRTFLIDFIVKNKIKSLVDAPCGDFNWMKHVTREVGVKYIGIDIVEKMIKKNIKYFKNVDTNFICSDLTVEKIPNCDLILVKDFLLHLSFDDTDRFLKNLSNTSYKYILISNHILEKSFRNKDIRSGDYRRIDLFKKPYKFSQDKIIKKVKDYPHGHPKPKNALLFKKEDIPKRLSY